MYALMKPHFNCKGRAPTKWFLWLRRPLRPQILICSVGGGAASGQKEVVKEGEAVFRQFMLLYKCGQRRIRVADTASNLAAH
jgi:hypothetical protein